MAEIAGVPGGAQVWRVDGKHVYLVYTVPNTNPPVPMLYHVNKPEDLNALFEGGGPVTYDRELTRAEVDQEGAIPFGTATELRNTAEEPFETFLQTYEEEAAIRPWLKDPEILALTAGGILEGRAVTEAELKNTDWWRTRNEQQRQWAGLVASDPATARQQMRDARIATRNTLIEAGYQNPGDRLVTHLADQFARGDVSETVWRENIRRETDPSAPNASPFAGQYMQEGDQVIQAGDGNYYIRRDGEDYRLTGPGQIARFVPLGYEEGAENIGRTLGGGQLVKVEGTDEHYFKTSSGRWLQAGPGAAGQLERLLGQPASVVPRSHVGDVRGPLVADEGGLFKPGELEDMVEMPNEAGTAAELFSGDPDVSGLGGLEEVRQLALQWLGPVYGGGWSDAQLGEWAGKIRQNENAREDLIETLRSQRMALFPQYENENLTYEDIAGPWRGFMQQQWGQTPDETDPLFARIVGMNDAMKAGQVLREEGLKRNVGQVVDSALGDLGKAFGDQVRPSQAVV